MILIADDDKSIRTSLSLLLKRAGHEVITAATADEALAAVRGSQPRLVISDMNFGGSTSGRDGIELLRKLRILIPETPVILITAWGSIPLAVEGMKYGAFDFITKPWDSRLLLQRVETALSLSQSAAAHSCEFDRCGIVGESPALTDVLDTVSRIAPTDASVLITGENGTGKELVARAIHANSQRASGPFVAVNLGGLPRSLFESEMFGHAKGAFTGAVQSREGRLKAADGGTIFLDEIGDLDPNCQVKMLRALQEHSFEPLGESRPVRSDMRVVCATNADLERMIRERTFREDLFYRINTITIHMPTLRERRDDIPRLVRHFAMQHAEAPEFSAEALRLLTSLPWPGNIRQLRNVVDRAILVSGKRLIEAADIDAPEAADAAETETSAAPAGAMTLEEMERAAIVSALRKHDGNLSNVAAELGITRQSLYRRMEKHDIRP